MFRQSQRAVVKSVLRNTWRSPVTVGVNIFVVFEAARGAEAAYGALTIIAFWTLLAFADRLEVIVDADGLYVRHRALLTPWTHYDRRLFVWREVAFWSRTAVPQTLTVRTARMEYVLEPRGTPSEAERQLSQVAQALEAHCVVSPYVRPQRSHIT